MLSAVLTTTVVVIALAAIAGLGGSALGFYRLDVVLSGSMEPAYDPGDMVYAVSVPTERLRTGDVIMLRTPEAYGDETVTHRITAIAMSEDGIVSLRTKGDANEDPDPWNAEISTAEVWVVKQKIPKVGWISHWSKTWWPMLIAGVVALPMLSYARRSVREAYATPPARHARSAAEAANNENEATS